MLEETPVRTRTHASAFMRGIALSLLLLAVAVAAPADSPMKVDPAIVPPEGVVTFNPRLMELWLDSLLRPDAESRQLAAHAIGKAHLDGMIGVLDRAGTALLAALDAKEQHPAVRMAAATSLIQIDARSAAASLLAHNQTRGQDMILLTDPALAAWDHEPARAVWRQRLTGEDVTWAVRKSAIDSLGVVGDSAAVKPLRDIAMNRKTDMVTRAAAAKALGRCAKSGLTGDASSLAGSADPAERIAAAAMLGSHRDKQSLDLLVRLVGDDTPAVTAAAMRELVALEPARTEPLLPRLAASDDANVRKLAAQAMTKIGTAKTVAMLADLLADADPDLRAAVRDDMIRFGGKADLRDVVTGAAARVLANPAWRGREQAAIIVGQLNEKAAADALVNVMLNTPRHEARLAAIVALRRLAEPRTIDPLMRHAQALHARTAFKATEQMQLDLELAQLFQTFGQLGHRDAEQLMRTLIPKNSGYSIEARSAAIWALGKLLAGTPDAGLTSQLMSRLADVAPMEPEAEEVRIASVIAVGRMKAANQVANIEKWTLPENSSSLTVTMACNWAIHEITGRPIPPVEAPAREASGYFLEPI